MDPADAKELERLRKDQKRAEKKDNLKEVAQLCNCIGELLAKYGQYEEAIQEHEKELSLCEAFQDQLGEAVASRRLGECYCGLGQYDRALQLQQRHLQLARSCEDGVEEQRALATIGRTHLCQAESLRDTQGISTALTEAQKSFLKALEVCERIKSSLKEEEYMEMKARLFLNLGIVGEMRGDLKKSTEYIKRAVSIAERYRLHGDVCRSQAALAGLYQRAGNWSQALRALDEARRAAVKVKDTPSQMEMDVTKALVYVQVGDFSHAKHCLKMAFKLAGPTSAQVPRLKKFFKAVRQMEEADGELKEAEGDAARSFALLERKADAAVDLTNYRQAIDFYLKLLEVGKQITVEESRMAAILYSLAQTYSDDKQYDQAVTFYRKELQLRGDDHEQICRTWLNIAEAQELGGRGYAEVSSSYVTAFNHAHQAKHVKLQVQCLKSLVEVQRLCGQTHHLQQTEAKLQRLRNRHGLSSDDDDDDEGSEEDSEPAPSEEEDALSIGELTESDASGQSDEEAGSTQKSSVRRSKASSLRTKKNEKGETPLHRACIEGNLKKVQKLLQQGHPVNPRDYCGWLPLHEAANHGHCSVVAALLDAGGWVNDRGDRGCDGVTPLIDAASNGHTDVIQLLVSRGANILAKDDTGLTALEYLREWFACCEDDGPEVTEKFRATESLLQDWTAAGQHRHRPRPSSRQVKDTTAHCPAVPHAEDTLPVLDAGRRQRRQKSRLPRPTDEQELSLADSDEDIYENPDLERLRQEPASATDSYRHAMKAVGSSALRQSSQPSSSTFRPSTEPDDISGALLKPGEGVDDDWLINDCLTTKRKRGSEFTLFSSSGTRSTERQSSRKKRRSLSPLEDSEVVTNRRMIGHGRNKIVVSDSEEDEEVGRDVERADSDGDVGNSDCDVDNHFRLSDDEMLAESPLRINDDVDVSDSSNDALPSLSGFTRRSALKNPTAAAGRKPQKARQLSLNSFAVRSGTPSSPATTQEPLTCGDRWSGTSASSSATLAPRGGEGSVKLTCQTDVMRLRVRIQDKTLLIPVRPCDQGRSVSWLAEEAGTRYYSLYGMRPQLTLSTGDGAILAPDDVLSLVMSSSEEVKAAVDSWDLPPADERYHKACESLRTVEYKNISRLLKASETSGCLSLHDLALRPPHLQPVWRAIQGQTTLTDLNLQGNRLGDMGLETLTRALDSIPGLTCLNLAANELTGEGLRHLEEVIRKSQVASSDGSSSSGPVLQRLARLVLSHNPLGDGCMASLASVIRGLRALTSLALSACQLTSALFTQHRLTLAQALQGSQLLSLDVSYNRLGSLGLEQLLRCLNKLRTVQLNLSGTHTGVGISHISLHLQQLLQPPCVLEELSLANCQLTPDDADLVSRLPEQSATLRSLDVSGNCKFDGASLQTMLQSSSQPSCHLERVIARGCSIGSPLPSLLLDALGAKLNAPHPLLHLQLTCLGLDKVDRQSLEQLWQDRWSAMAQVDVHSAEVCLGVAEDLAGMAS